MPSRRTSQLAEPLSPLIAHLKIRENPAIAPAVTRAVDIGFAMAMFLGTSSPKIIENDVAKIRATAREMPDARESEAPSAVVTGRMNPASTGSAR